MTTTPSGRASRACSWRSACVAGRIFFRPFPSRRSLARPPRSPLAHGFFFPAARAARSSCENQIDKWYTEEPHNDNFQHTTSGSYGPANFQTETLALVFWCHNKITPCQLKIDAVSIGESANATALVEEA